MQVVFLKNLNIDRSVSFCYSLLFKGGKMHLGHVIIYVKNIQETVAFYEKAFGIKRRFIHESGVYAEMETESTALAFVDEEFAKPSLSFRPNRPSEEAAGIEISLITDHVEQQFDKAVQAGAVSVIKPTQKPWGQMVCYVKDNNGCLVELCSPIEGS